MLRAAAKNFHHTIVVCRQEQYDQFDIDGVSIQQSKELAAEVFSMTSDYDLDVSNWFYGNSIQQGLKKLRYGENPHQEGLLSVNDNPPIDFLKPIQGKEISYNNVSDALAAWACVHEFTEPSVCIVKHTNPCGVASAKNITEAYGKAFQTDPTSAFGGVIASNMLIDEECAEKMIDTQFIEVLVAPDFSIKALEILLQKPNIRVLKSNGNSTDIYENKMIHGVGLIQSTDLEEFSEMNLDFVTTSKPNETEIEDLIFAMKVAKHAKSNAIVLAKNKMTLGVGAGQMSRVVSMKNF